jgi:DNA replication and repair protein RecF
VTGANGAGKTSLLEAIAYSSTLASFRGTPRETMIRDGASESVIRVETETESRIELVEIAIGRDKRDRVLRNHHRPSRNAELLETLRVTVFTPDDLALVKGGPQYRRDFLDDALVAAFPKRLELRHNVERILRQRGTLLRQAGGFLNRETSATLDVWDEQLALAGDELVRARQQLLDEIAPLADAAFRDLSRDDEPLNFSYVRSFEGDLAEALKAARDDDVRRQATTVGPHRDDVSVMVGALDARTRVSQGRQRCATLALRLAAHGAVTNSAQTAPVLLLDDAFSELDSQTADALFRELPTGQAILTTAGPLPPGASPASLVRVVDGSLVE